MYNTQLTPPLLDYSMMDFDYSQQGAATLNQPFMNVNLTPKSAHDSVFETPPRTPIVFSGPRLIPKVRVQDQIVEPVAAAGRYQSPGLFSNAGFPVTPSSYIQGSGLQRSCSPASTFQKSSPLSNSSPCFQLGGPNLCGPIAFNSTPSRPSLYHGRSISDSAIMNNTRDSSASNHTRNLSAPSIDGAVLTRYGFPTYRDIPRGYPTKPQAVSALSHLMPSAMAGQPNSSVASFSQARSVTPPQFQQAVMTQSQATPIVAVQDKAHQNLISNLAYNNSVAQHSTSTLQAYLSAPNPSPSLVQHLMEPVRGQSTHFWYDIRNLRKWADFNIDTVTAMPDLLHLLQLPLSSSTLPTPRKRSEVPENIAQLHELLRDHFAVKVNAALKVCLGPNALEMRSLHTTSTSAAASMPYHTRPEYLAICPSDTDKTFESQQQAEYQQPQQRGRVVGIVKAYKQWNSGMRAEGPANKVKYLAGLSTLHKFMREHGCRYGFLITEIELVCVRYGGDDGAAIPWFGHLEISDPIRLSTHSSFSSSEQQQQQQQQQPQQQPLQMTAALALLYLHLLAKTQPLPGQHGWKLDVGGPAALTRQKHMVRDEWMPKPNQCEKREARRNRGWIWPDEPLSTRERGKAGKKVRRRRR